MHLFGNLRLRRFVPRACHILALLIASVALAQPALFVDAQGTPPVQDGRSWATAFTSLQSALAVARVTSDITEIRVAGGVYRPAGFNSSPDIAFRMQNNLAILGGYAGSRYPNSNLRDIDVFRTILSGDLDQNDGPDFANNDENSYHVLTAVDVGPSALIEGFTVTGGAANGINPNHRGGGVFIFNASPTFRHCRFIENAAYSGGAVYAALSLPRFMSCDFERNIAVDAASADGGAVLSVQSTFTCSACTFRENIATASGGAIASDGAGPVLFGCHFSGNTASSGGAIHCVDDYAFLQLADRPLISNSMFHGNLAGSGGAIHILNSAPLITNCLFLGNIATNGGAFYSTISLHSLNLLTLTHSTLTGNLAFSNGGGINDNTFSDETIVIEHTILFNNRDNNGTLLSSQIFGSGAIDVSYSCVQGWIDDGVSPGMISDDPLFLDSDGADGIAGNEDDNLRLSPNSPCIDAGDPAITQPLLETDLDGHARILCDILDIGAYESGFGDIDCNRVVDVFDFGSWEVCVAQGMAGKLDPVCVPFDADADGDIDILDFQAFQIAFNGLD